MKKKKKPWRKKAKKSYPLNASLLYKITTRKKLATVLNDSIGAIQGMIDPNVPHYHYWRKKKKDGSERDLCEPFKGLDKVQSRIAYLLQSIEMPDYVHAPVKGRNYVTNAAKHRGSRKFCLMDIEDFYPSCREEKVFHFFHKKMKCAPDVASILAALCCDKGSLPQGSPSSPFLSYWAYSEMWDEIYSIASSSGNIFTLYLDDLTISGEKLSGETVWEIKKQIHKHGLRLKTKKTRWSIGRPVNVTGGIVAGSELRLPHKQYLKLQEAENDFKKAGGNRKKKTNVLRGRKAQAQQVLDGNLLPQ